MAIKLSVVYNYKDLFSTEPVVFSCLSFECPYQWPVIVLWETRDQCYQDWRLELPSLEDIEIVYVSPETLIGNTEIILKLREHLLGIVVDESHCVNNW